MTSAVENLPKEFEPIVDALRTEDGWMASRSIKIMLAYVKGNDLGTAAVVRSSFTTLLKIEEHSAGFVRTIIENLRFHSDGSPELRQNFIECGSAALKPIAKTSVYSAEQLVLALRVACRDDAALLAKVDQGIKDALLG